MESPAPSVGSSSLCTSTSIWCPLAPANGPAQMDSKQAPQCRNALHTSETRLWPRLESFTLEMVEPYSTDLHEMMSVTLQSEPKNNKNTHQISDSDL